jgi:hypothetical protein
MVSVGEDGRALVPLPRGVDGGGRLEPAEALDRATRIALGAAGLALAVLRALLERPQPAGQEVRVAGATVTAAPRPAGMLRMLPAAALGLGLEAQRRSLDAATALGARLAPPLSAAARPAAALAGRPLAVAWRRLDLDGWAARGLAEQRRNQQAAAEATSRLVGAIVAAVLDEVDLNGVVARVDLDAIAARIDLDAIAARIDLNAIAARIDLNAIVARIDLNAIVASLDLAGLTEQVIDEVDLGEIIRESSGSMATETVDALRVQGMRGDQLVSRLVDRVLLRKGERPTGSGAVGP